VIGIADVCDSKVVVASHEKYCECVSVCMLHQVNINNDEQK